MDDLLNTKQAAEYCGMSERCINIAVKENRLALATQSTHRKHYFDKSELQRFQATRPASKIECSKDWQSVKATATTSSVVALSELSVDPEFEKLIAPLTTAELQQLTESCSAEGIRDPILLWNGTIVDGHNRYRIAQTLGLDSVPVKSMSFSSRNAAKSWIVENQLGRRNVSTYERCRLALLLKDSVAAAANQRMLAGKTDPTQISAEGTTGETRDILAKKAGVSHDTLSKVETLEREANDELKSQLRADSISINKAWKTLQSQQPKTNKNATALLDTLSQSADTSSTPNPVDNDTTPTASDVVTQDPQVSVASKHSDDDVSDSEKSPKSMLEFIPHVLAGFYQDFIQFISNNDVYCNEEVLEKEWAQCFTAVVSTDFSNAFWQKLQQARKNHSLSTVIALVPLDSDIDNSFSNDILFAITNICYYDDSFHIFVFDFTEEAEMTT